MISHFFIDRPIFASVLLDRLRAGRRRGRVGRSRWRSIPEVTPPTVLVTALYPGANAYTVRDTVAAPIEESVNGVEGMMYMSSQSTNDGSLPPGRDLQAGHGFGHGPGAGAEPRLAGPAGDSGPGPERGHQRQEGLAQHDDDREPGLEGRDEIRCHVPEQLRHDLHPRRIGAAAGRGRRDLLRPARLQPAGLARPRQTGRPGARARRRRGGHHPAEPAGRRRPDRPAARPQGPAVPTHHQYAGPAHRPAAVRRHHHQGRIDHAGDKQRAKRQRGGIDRQHQQ